MAASKKPAEPRPVQGRDLLGRVMYYRPQGLQYAFSSPPSIKGTVVGVHDLQEDQITELAGAITTRRKHIINLVLRNAQGEHVTRSLDDCVPAAKSAKGTK